MSRRNIRVVSERPFPQWLREFMQTWSLRPRDVALRADVSTKGVHEWVRGRGPLHPDHVIAKLKAAETAPHPTETPESNVARQLLMNGGISDALEDLARSVESATASVEASELPPAYRDRLRER